MAVVDAYVFPGFLIPVLFFPKSPTPFLTCFCRGETVQFEEFGDDILNVVQMMTFVTNCVENIVGKGENAGHQHFLLFPQCFQKASFPGSIKVGIVW